MFFIEPELLPIEVVHCGYRGIFDLFCSCDLDLMTFIYDLKPYSLNICLMCENEYAKAFKSYHLTDIQTEPNVASQIVTNFRFARRGRKGRRWIEGLEEREGGGRTRKPNLSKGPQVPCDVSLSALSLLPCRL